MLVMTMMVVARVVEVMLASGWSVTTPPAKSSQWLDVDVGGAGDDLNGSGGGG